LKYKLVLWDIDGTIYDAEYLINNFILDKETVRAHYDHEDNKIEELFEEFKSLVDGPYEGLLDLMENLQEEGSLQGVMSNGPGSFQYWKIPLFGIEDYLDEDLIFISGTEAEKLLKQKDHPLLEQFSLDEMTRYQKIDGVQKKVTYKPSTYMFEEALRISGFKADECVMVGDQPSDYAGAKKVGMDAIFIEGMPLWPSHQETNETLMEKYKPDYSVKKGDIKSLREILI